MRGVNVSSDDAVKPGENYYL